MRAFLYSATRHRRRHEGVTKEMEGVMFLFEGLCAQLER